MHGTCIYYVDIIDWQFGDYFSKQMNLQEMFHKFHIPKGFYWYKNLNFLEKIWGDDAVDHETDL